MADLHKRSAEVWTNCEDMPAADAWQKLVAENVLACAVLLVVVGEQFDFDGTAFQAAVATQKPIVLLSLRKVATPGKSKTPLDSYQCIDFGIGSYHANVA